MDDIVKRLDEAALWEATYTDGRGEATCNNTAWVREAAAEIKRLRTAVATAYGDLWWSVGPSCDAVHHARRTLLAVLSKPQQQAAVEDAIRRLGPVPEQFPGDFQPSD